MSPQVVRATIFYDGLCGFCNGFIRFLVRVDRNELLLFAPLQSPLGEKLTSEHDDLKNIDSAVFVELFENGQERRNVKSRLVVRLAPYLPLPWRWIFRMVWLIPPPIANVMYDLFARWRYRIFGKYDTCPIPSPELKRRLSDYVRI